MQLLAYTPLPLLVLLKQPLPSKTDATPKPPLLASLPKGETRKLNKTNKLLLLFSFSNLMFYFKLLSLKAVISIAHLYYHRLSSCLLEAQQGRMEHFILYQQGRKHIKTTTNFLIGYW